MKKALLGVFVLATFAMTPVFAASTTTTTSTSHETIQGNELLFGSNALTMPITISPFTVTVNAGVGYQRAVMANVQAGVRANMGIASAAQAWDVAPWLVYNLDEKWTDSIFIGAGLGIKNKQTVAGYLDINIGAEVGKRFEVCHGLVWRPNVAMGKLLDGSNITWTLNLVNFSYMW
jgi:hypothetical protein